MTGHIHMPEYFLQSALPSWHIEITTKVASGDLIHETELSPSRNCLLQSQPLAASVICSVITEHFLYLLHFCAFRR